MRILDWQLSINYNIMEFNMLLKKYLYVTLLSFTGFLFGCGDKIEPGTTGEVENKMIKTAVTTARVIQQPFIYEAVGTVQARTFSTLSSKLMEAVTAVNVREGDLVKKGDLLVVIDDRQVSAQLRKAQATLAEAKRAEISAESVRDAAKAGARLAGATYKRYLNLMEEESASRQEFDEVEARFRQSEASLAQTEAMVEAASYRVQQAEAAVSAARVGKKDASVRAPYDGKVTAKMVDEGDLAAPGTPLLALDKEGVHCVALVLPEKHIQSIRLKQKVKVKIPSIQDRSFEGFIGRIDPSADPKSRTFRVRVALLEDKNIRSGMFARVEIPAGEAGMLLIPLTAVRHEGQLTGIYLVDSLKLAHFRLVRIGRTFGDTVEVISGLKEGGRYVVDPPSDLMDGVKVEDVL
jgi:multidrug efflux pump subunit AcrA (membrane-fusion protein)